MKKHLSFSLLVTLLILLFPRAGMTQIITAGGFHSHYVCNAGNLQSWGINSFGQLGNPVIGLSSVPVDVPLSGIVAMDAGAAHTLVVKNDGTVWAWGYNAVGQLGDSTIKDRHAPVKVVSLTGIVAIAAGNNHSLAVKNDGTVWAWGYNEYGQLGDSTFTDRHTPVQVLDLCSVATGIKELHTQAEVSIFPNPSSNGQINLSSTEIMSDVKIMDMTGRLIYHSTPKDNNVILKIETSGIYFIQTTSGKETSVKKIVVNN